MEYQINGYDSIPLDKLKAEHEFYTIPAPVTKAYEIQVGDRIHINEDSQILAQDNIMIHQLENWFELEYRPGEYYNYEIVRRK